jgi:diaminopimelate epimerase
MTGKVPFTKMHGAGNDFIVIDNRNEYITGQDQKLIQRLCRRNFGIGADGLMLIQFKEPDQFHISHFNADGHPAEMCGNGARCAVWFMSLLNPEKKRFQFEIFNKFYLAEVVSPNRIRIFWKSIPEVIEDKQLEQYLPKDFIKYSIVDSGVPHLVLLSDLPVDTIAVEKWGRYFRYHKYFVPKGINVNFIQIDKGNVNIRTFERGVEGETLACGTGAIASALAGQYWKKIGLPVDIMAKGGKLRVGMEQDQLWLEGPVQKVFSGSFDLSD